MPFNYNSERSDILIENNLSIVDIKSLLDVYIQKGFSVCMLSKLTNIKEDLILKMVSTDNFQITLIPTNDIAYLHILLTQLFCVSPKDSYYLIGMIESLQNYFGISMQAIANYLNITIEELENAMLDIELLQKFHPEITHLSMTLFRNKRFSFEKL